MFWNLKHNKFQESGLPTRRFLLYACLDLLDCSRMKDFLNKLQINKKADEFFLSSVYQLLTGFPVSLKTPRLFSSNSKWDAINGKWKPERNAEYNMFIDVVKFLDKKQFSLIRNSNFILRKETILIQRCRRMRRYRSLKNQTLDG